MAGAELAHAKLNNLTHSTRNEDCLHSCMPGPVDVAVQLLFNLLLQHNTLASHRSVQFDTFFIDKNLTEWLSAPLPNNKSGSGKGVVRPVRSGR